MALISLDEHFPIEPPTSEMASHQFPIPPPQSKPKFNLDSQTELLEEMNSYQLYPESEHIFQEARSESHKGEPTPRMGECIRSLDNEEVERCLNNQLCMLIG